jgi:hypothetical protein
VPTIISAIPSRYIHRPNNPPFFLQGTLPFLYFGHLFLSKMKNQNETIEKRFIKATPTEMQRLFFKGEKNVTELFGPRKKSPKCFGHFGNDWK